MALDYVQKRPAAVRVNSAPPQQLLHHRALHATPIFRVSVTLESPGYQLMNPGTLQSRQG